MVLTSIRPAARDANFYTFARADGACLPASMAGAHIAVELPNGVMRDYSLITPLDAPHDYTVCVKLESDGRGSSYLHSKAQIGDRLSITPPRNNFPLNEAAPYSVLIAGGIGITPIYSMLTRLSALGHDWELHYACQTRGDAVFLSELEKRPNVHLHFDDESEGQYLNVSRIVAEAPPECHLYCCGPTPMMMAFEKAAASAKYPADAVHVEYFKSKFEPALRGGFTVKLARDGRKYFVPPGKSILDVLRDAGMNVVSSCEVGVCGSCETTVLEGIPDHRDEVLLEHERLKNKSMMICCSGAKSDILVLDL